MSKRRTAEEAFQMPASVKDFINRGVQESGNVQASTPNVDPSTDRNQSVPHEKVIELDDERQVHTTSRRTGQGHRASRSPQTSPGDLTRTYAKATVQKTVRFHPRLIAELEAFSRQLELDAEKPVAFQQIQNEALDLWLDKYVRRAK